MKLLIIYGVFIAVAILAVMAIHYKDAVDKINDGSLGWLIPATIICGCGFVSNVICIIKKLGE